MPFIITDEAINAACNAIVDLIDAGPAAGRLRIFDGAQPTNPDTALSGNNLLADMALNDPAFGNAVAGVATAGTSPAIQDTNTAAGTATFARVYNSNLADPADAVMDLDVGQGTGTINFNNTTFTLGGTATITSFTVTVPSGQ